jgi:hypothetical protein
MNSGTLRGSSAAFDLGARPLVNVDHVVIGSKVPPIGAGNLNLGTSAGGQPGINSVNPGNVQFDTPRLTSNGTYMHNLSPGAKFYGCWVLNDNVTVQGNGQSGQEFGGLYVRPQFFSSDGQGASRLLCGQDIVLTVYGTDTISQTVTFGPGALLFGNVTNAYGVRADIQTPDGAGNTIGIMTLFQGIFLKGNTTTVGTFVGLDLSNISIGAATTSWGIQVGSANNYYVGMSSFGKNSVPNYQVDVLGIVSSGNANPSGPGYRAAMTGTPAASSVLAGYQDTSTVALGSNAGAIYASFDAQPSIVGAATATYIGCSVNPTANTGAVTSGIGAAIGSAAGSGSWATFVGLDIGVTYPLAGTTTWALTVGDYNSYHLGTFVLGASTVPTTTAGGASLFAAPVLVSNGTYTVNAGGHVNFQYITWLINDTITVASSTTGISVYTLGLYPQLDFSTGQTGQSFAGVACSPGVGGSDTLSSINGLYLNAVTKYGSSVSATTMNGIASGCFWESSGTCATLNVFYGQSLRVAGTITTLIGLNLTSLNGGTTTWGMQVGNYQSYHQGKFTFGGTGAPSNTIDIQGGMLNYMANQSVSYTSGGNTTISATGGNYVDFSTISGNTTLIMSALPKIGTPLTIMITNDSVAARTITFSATWFRTTSATIVGTVNKAWIIQFISDGAHMVEKGRTGPL